MRHAAICQRMPLRLPNIRSIPSDAYGLYAFCLKANGRCIYVGKAEKQPLKVHLEQEWANSHNEDLRSWIQAFGNAMDICYLRVEKRKISRMERFFIHRWHPETNHQHKRR